MGPPPLSEPEWFLRNIVDRKPMTELGDRINRFYDDLFEEVVYRAHHNSFKVFFSDVFFNDFNDYVARSMGLRRDFWRRIGTDTAIGYMYQERKRFRRLLRRRKLIGDIKWSLPFYLSQLSFWYTTVKSFHDTWYRVVVLGEEIPSTVSWREGITLYIIYDAVYCFIENKDKCIKKKYIDKYNKYIEREEIFRFLSSN